MVTTADLKFEDAFIYSSLLTLADVVALQRSATLEYCGKPKRWFTGWTLIRMSPITVFFDTLLELNSLWNYRRTDGLVDEPSTKSWPWVELFLLLCEFVPWSTLIFAFGDVPIANVCAMIYLQGVIVHALHVRVVGKRFAKGKRAKTAYRCLLAAHILFFHVVLRALHARAPFSMQDVHETIQNLVTFNLGKVDWLVLDVLRKIVMPHLSYRWTSSGQYLLVQLYFLHNRMDYGFLNRYEPQVVQNALRYIVHESAWSALEGLIYVIPLQACAFGLWWTWSMLQWLFSKKFDKMHKE